jgi:RHS repeat-associated protein
LSDTSGNLVEANAYDSFGNNAGTGRTRYGYTGRERDPDTGLLYYRARFYDPQVGRFLSEDPIALKAGDLNLYAYVGNNPIKFTDPLGLQKRQDVDPPGTKYPTISVPQQRPKTNCCNKTWTECYAQCVENHRLDSLLPVLVSALPKRILPPFRVVESSQRLTTVGSTIAHYVPGARVLRGAGRFASRIGTPALVFEGFYDWGILGSCAELCQRNPCN